MPRRTTDLLDVFKTGGGGGTRQPASRPAKPSRPPRGRFEGIFLAPRQVLLASSIAVLLFVLSFTLGLGVGRKGGGDAPSSPALARETSIWVLRGRVARIDAGSGAEQSEARILRELERKYRVPPHMVRVDVRGDPYEILIGPFSSEKEAEAFHQQKGLETARLGSAAPFRLTRPQEIRRR